MSLILSNSRVKLSQGSIFWHEIGQGPTLIFLHGSWQHSEQWMSVITSLSPDYHCFAPDLLGFGESDQPNIHYSVELEAESIAELIEFVKLPSVYLVGHSLGGWIATNYALKHLDKVRGLILISPEGVEAQGSKNSWGWAKLFLGLPPIVFKFFRKVYPVLKLIGLSKQIDQVLLLAETPVACQLLFKRRRAEIKAELLNDRLQELTIPSLILQGQKDRTDAIAMSQTYSHLLPKAHLEIIPLAEHNLPEEQPDVVVQYIRNFCQRIENKT